jgi:2-oxoglutarate dehydrogenase E1 component
MQEGIMELMWSSSHVYGGNVSYVEGLYEQYLLDPNAIPEEWRNYFDKLPRTEGTGSTDIPLTPIREHFDLLAKNKHKMAPAGASSVSTDHEKKQVRVLQLINAYRFRGHQKANIDPLNLKQYETVADLDLAYHQLTAADMDTTFQTGSLFIGKDEAPLREIIEALDKTYCNTTGAEFMHIVNTEEKRWLQQRFESVRSAPAFGVEAKKHILERLTAAEGMENYLASRYPGTKRFGLEGGESFIPMVDELIQRSGSLGVKEVVIGMAHRGRLNVLVNVMGKNPSKLFDEFGGKHDEILSSGDVKYHQGYSSDFVTPGGNVHLALAFNPSHLEIVNPVVIGSVRARLDRRDCNEGDLVLPITIHGDSAIAGQGVVQETFNMSQARAFKVGGTIRIVVNNQVGFTTSNSEDTRSGEYCTEVAKMVSAPILHVNGDDPEAVILATQIALDYRNEFKRDVVIDLVCYRRHGHNEADEPSATQPLMYKKVKKHPTPRQLYADKLNAEGSLDKAKTDELTAYYRKLLDEGQCTVEQWRPMTEHSVDWSPYLGHEWNDDYDKEISLEKLKELAGKISSIPDEHNVHNRVKKIYDDRVKMASGEKLLDWGMAENLAYASIVDLGKRVRITGQDSGRGTFFHRHAVLHGQDDASRYLPLQNVREGQGPFDVHDSVLSEVSVLAFEYGYTTAEPSGLTIWEAQFGDFANCAQVVFDQFISSGEQKWGRLCGLTMLLPHGYEGQGPEHSSARLERFLQLCADHNWQVCVPSTPAQVYNMLVRQAVRPMRRPLVVMSPKSLLRHPLAVSSLEELSTGVFQNIIGEIDEIDPKQVTRVVMCSGKVYYDLLEKRRENKQTDVAIIRIEQLYPFPIDEINAELAQYAHVTDWVWCQEEPMNQGAWYCSQHRFYASIPQGATLTYAGRDASASPAVGYISVHNQQQKQLVDDALTIK